MKIPESRDYLPVERSDEAFIENTKAPSFEIQHVMAQPQEVHDPPCTPNRNMHDRVNNQIQLNRRDINIGSSNGSNIAQEAQIVTQPSVTNVTDMMNVTFAQVQYPIQAIQSAVSLQDVNSTCVQSSSVV